MVMGDRIKTWQQLLDEQADGADFATTPRDDRHDQSAHPHQAYDSTGEHK